MSQDTNPEDAIGELKSRCQSVLLSTVGANGDPHVGYTPFIIDNLDIVVFVSQLALHTRDLLADPRVSAMIIDDESESSQIFARSRVTYQCHANVVSPEDDAYEPLLEQLQSRHGKMIGLLRQLPDFVLFRLSPEQGQFVMGFGKAYRLTGKNLDGFELATRA